MYSLEHLRMLLLTVETGSFSACARKLGKVQSAVSQGIAALEDDLDIILFDRTTRKPTLTPEGARILEFARSILLQVDDLAVAANAIHEGEEASVCLAIDRALSVSKVNAILRLFDDLYPTTELELILTASPDIGRLITNGRADVGVIFSEIQLDSELEHCFIGNLPFYPVCSSTHPLKDVSNIRMMDLARHRQILLRGEIGSGLDFFPKMSTQAWYANDFYAITRMVKAGFGWAYIPAHIFSEYQDSSGLCRLHFGFDHKPWSPPVELVRQQHGMKGPAARWLYDALKALLED